jgi:hypothetical protein
MDMEYVGLVEVDPCFSRDEVNWIVEANATGWIVSRDGRVLGPRPGVDLEMCVQGLRDLVALGRGEHRFDGAVAVYDAEGGALVLLTVANGKVSRRTLRSRPAPPIGSNVIDLASRRRRTRSRAI